MLIPTIKTQDTSTSTITPSYPLLATHYYESESEHWERLAIRDSEGSFYNNTKMPFGPGPIWNFYENGCSLESKSAVLIRLYKIEDLYFAECDALNVFVHGETKDDALDEFNALLFFHYNKYTNTPDNQLSPKALELKRLFQNTFTFIDGHQ